MGKLTTFDIYKVLERSNCKECGLPTCMAFAALVYQGQRKLEDCPRLDEAVAAKLVDRMAAQPEMDWTGDDAVQAFKSRFHNVDFAARADMLGGWTKGDRLVFHCLGKVFEVDRAGDLHSDCHQNPWLHVPLLSYVLDSRGLRPEGQWVRFQELKKAKSWIRFFEHSCEAVLQQLSEADPVLTLDILELFASRTTVHGFAADAVFLLYPLPRLPFLFAYVGPEDPFRARLSVYLDRTADDNLDPESLFRLGRGLAEMFRRIAMRHGLSL